MTPITMWPPAIRQRPPNIFCSLIGVRVSSAARTRSANASS